MYLIDVGTEKIFTYNVLPKKHWYDLEFEQLSQLYVSIWILIYI